MVEALREEGFDVIHATNGEEALAWCGRHVADVLITDIMLSGSVDGWQIAERCREHDPGLPVIYATGWTLDRTVPNAVKAHTGEGMFDLCFFSQTKEGWRAWKKMKGYS